MAVGVIAPAIVFTGFDNNGDPLSGGLLYTYVAGTTTPQTTYSDPDLTVANPNPCVLNAGGRPSNAGTEYSLFLQSASYKFVLKTSAGVTVWERDNISPEGIQRDLEIRGVAGETLTSGDGVYLSD